MNTVFTSCGTWSGPTASAAAAGKAIGFGPKPPAPKPSGLVVVKSPLVLVGPVPKQGGLFG